MAERLIAWSQYVGMNFSCSGSHSLTPFGEV
jgi:hypothetical protein